MVVIIILLPSEAFVKYVLNVVENRFLMSYNIYATSFFVLFVFLMRIVTFSGGIMDHTTLRKNPSRETCEGIIKRILMTEVLEQGSNKHFRSASDFMNYFESLYPASDALSKQVQRAVKALNMPKDEKGFFIVNKTSAQLDHEKEISHLFSAAHVTIDPMEKCETIFLSADAPMRDYLIYMLETSETFRGKFLTIVPASNGLVIYTQNRNQLLILLNSLTI